MTFDRSGISAIPRPKTDLVGRVSEIATIQALLSDPLVRVVTLTGPGGVGKTRLALHVALTVPGFPHGRWYIELAGLSEPALILPQIARALGVRERAGQSIIEQVVAVLEDKQTLLVLDNFEHLLAGATAVAQLLGRVDGLKLLITSRAPLNLTSEHVLSIGPLGVHPTAEIPQGEAVELFLQRIRLIRPGYESLPNDRESIEQICLQLAGLPLAIELAAARMRVLSPQVLLDRLRQPLELLSDESNDMPERHRSMRAAIGWSYRLLTPEQQAVLRLMGIFAGTVPLEGIEVMATAAGISDREEVVDLAAGLIDASMIEPASSDSGETRFLVYATVREFARDELERRDELAWARDLHAGWIESLIAGFERATYGADEGRMHARLRVELDNIRAALAWSLESGNLARAARIAGNLWSLWSFGGQSDEGRRWMDRILPLLPGSALAPEDERPLQFGAAMVAWAQNDAERAAAHCDRLLALARQLDNPVWQADALMWGAQAAWYANDYERVVELATSALALQEVAPVQAACAQTLLGIVAMRTGRLDDAGIAFERARERLVAQRNTRALIWTLQLIADLRLLQGDDAAFARAHRESLQLALAAADHWGMFENFAGLLTVALRLGWTNEALELLASAELLRTGYSVLPRAGSWLSTDDRVQLRNGLGEDDLLRLSENAASRPLPELVERASEIAREIEQGAKQPAAVQRAVNPHGTSAFALSAREQEVLELLVQGLTDRQIGAELSISQKTARTHVAHVLHKLDARNRAAAVRLALELQMV